MTHPCAQQAEVVDGDGRTGTAGVLRVGHCGLAPFQVQVCSLIVDAGVRGQRNRMQIGHRVSRPRRGVGVERPAHPVPSGGGGEVCAIGPLGTDGLLAAM